MARIQLYFYVFLIISCKGSEEDANQCPKLCQCEHNEETGLKVKCENIKDIKEIIFGENSSEIVHL
jgi:hypothetical protein